MTFDNETITKLALIAGITTVLSVWGYAESVPSLQQTPQGEINSCQNYAYQHIDGHLRVEEQERILKSCSDAMLHK